MIGNERKPIVGLVLFDFLIAAAALFLAYLVRAELLTAFPSIWTGKPSLWPSYAVLFIGTLPILLTALYMAGAYAPNNVRSLPLAVWAITRGTLAAAVGVLAFAYVLRDHTYSRAIVGIYLLLCALGFTLVRYAYALHWRARLRRGNGLERALIVGTGSAAKTIHEVLESKPHLGYKVIGHVRVPEEQNPLPDLPSLGTIEELPELVDRLVVDAVIFAIPLHVAANYEAIIWSLEEVGKTIHLRGDAIGVLLSRTFIGEFQGIPILTLQSTPSDPVALQLKRFLDIVFSAAGLIVLSPVMLAAAAAIKFTSPGPVLFRQRRVGLNGRHFYMLKFRSMYVDAEQRLQELRDKNEVTGPVFKMKRDPRVTPVGRFLRRFSIDELPQLINVLRGEMSIVGPRPPLPEEVARYERWQRRRLSMKPGLTCIWQVAGRSDVSFEEWMAMDLEYIDNWSLWLDLKLIFRTIPVVLTAKGAY